MTEEARIWSKADIEILTNALYDHWLQTFERNAKRRIKDQLTKFGSLADDDRFEMSYEFDLNGSAMRLLLKLLGGTKA